MLWFSALYLPLALVVAARKHLWNDELFTYYISRLGSIHAIHDALLVAADQNPPPFYWLSYAGMNLESGTLGIRLPAIFGVWLLGVSLVVWFSRYGLPIYGLVAALLAVNTGAYMYATEARPYGLVMGLSALAVVCWQHASVGEPARWAAAGLGVSLAGAISSHYYAVLLLPALFLAEMAWVWEKRHIRWPIWLALAAGVSPLLIWLPLIQAARGYSGTFWAKATAGSVAEFYEFVLLPALLPVMALAFTASVLHYWRRSRGGSTFAPTFPEVVCVLTVSAMPVAAVALGRFVTGAYTHRYVIFATVGIVIFITWLLAQVLGGRTVPALVCAALLSLFFAARETRSFRMAGGRSNHFSDIEFLTKRAPAGDIAIADPHLFFELSHQAPPALRSRIYYVADRAAALRNVGTDAVDRSVIDMKPFAGLRVRGLEDVLASEQQVRIYGHPAYWAWLVGEFMERGVPLGITGASNARLLLVAEPSGRDVNRR